MADVLALLSNFVTIAAGVLSGAFFLYRHRHISLYLSKTSSNSKPSSDSKSSSDTTTASDSKPSSDSKIPSRPSSHSVLNMARVGLILSIIIIITGAVSAYLLLLPGIVAKQHQDFYNRQVMQQPTYFTPLSSADNQWDTGQPYGEGGHCQFQNQAFDVFMNTGNHYYPCYMATPYSNFMIQVQLQIQKGEDGGIIFRDDGHRPDFYYFHLAATGIYNLDYWPDGSGKKVVNLIQGNDSEIYLDHIQGRFSTVAVAAQGGEISLYIDGLYTGSVQDTRINSGRIALVAQKLLNDTEVLYKQVQLWSL